MTWKPHVTVAAVIEYDDRFLCVEEIIAGQRRLNQPAGHLEPGESLEEAVQREVMEETRFEFFPSHLTGVYLWRAEPDKPTFLRATFTGTLGIEHKDQALDPDIDAVTWLSDKDILGRQTQWRSPLVGRCILDYLAGTRHPLSCLVDLIGQT